MLCHVDDLIDLEEICQYSGGWAGAAVVFVYPCPVLVWQAQIRFVARPCACEALASAICVPESLRESRQVL